MTLDYDQWIPVAYDQARKGDKRKHPVKGVVVGWVNRGKRGVHAIVIVRRSFEAVPLGELRFLRSKKDR